MDALKKLLTAFTNLLKVRSLWSLGALSMFIYMIVKGIIDGQTALTIIMAIVTFYFAKEQNGGEDK